MSNVNFVNYQVALIPENAALIDQLNQLLISGKASAGIPEHTNTTGAEGKKTTSTGKNTQADDQREAAKSQPDSTTIEQVKTAAKAAKKEHGEDFANSVLDSAGVKAGASLGRRMGAIPEDKYDEVIELWKAGPQTEEGDLDEDDGFGDDDDGLGDTPSVSPEAVQKALKAYSKEVGRAEAKKIMTDNGANALSEVPNCSPEQLAAMMAELV